MSVALTKDSKVLIIRLSSIGDIVLCTPIIRCLKNQIGCKIHFMVKGKYSEVLQSNPYIDHQLVYEETAPNDLVSEKYDLVIDLHKNLRTQKLKFRLSTPSISFNKLNIEKWLLTNFRIDRMPPVHLVDRYFDAVNRIGIQNDGEGLDYFLSEKSDVEVPVEESFVALVIGAAHFTKQIPVSLCRSIVEDCCAKVVLLGGAAEIDKSQEVVKGMSNCINMVGNLSLNESASVVKQSQLVITSDTGLMHISAALKKPMITVWGSTAPVLGMYPYYGKYEIEEQRIEIKSLNCRPCTKIGRSSCPKGHFNCMTKLSPNDIISTMNDMILRN